MPIPTFTPSPTPTFAATPIPPKVVIISLDGLRPDALLQAVMPNIKALATRGAYTWKAQTVFPPVTLPAHASMLSGYPPEAHSLTWNDYQPARGAITVTTIFSLAHAAGLRTVMVAGKEKLAHLNAPGTVDVYVFAANGDQDVADQAIAQIPSGFDLMFVHFPNTDYFGHLAGWMSATQIAQLARTDEAVGRLLAALPSNTTVILTSDHGGHGLLHGADIPEDMTIPWIISGPSILQNHELTSPVSIMDTAATAAYVLGLSLPPAAEGTPIYEAFGIAQPPSPFVSSTTSHAGSRFMAPLNEPLGCFRLSHILKALFSANVEKALTFLDDRGAGQSALPHFLKSPSSRVTIPRR